MDEIKINAKILTWARTQQNLSVADLSTKTKISSEKIEMLESNDSSPTFTQLQKLSQALYIPVGYFFLDTIPRFVLPIKDFRTIGDKEQTSISLELQEVINDALRKRDWYREWKKAEGYQPLEFVGKFSVNTPVDEIIASLRKHLKIGVSEAARYHRWDEYLRFLVKQVESCGVIVLQNGVVGNNTSRGLSVEEFRGFAIADKYAPIIFINSRDAEPARIFTIMHELVHVWTGTSGISNPEFDKPESNSLEIEKFCNKVAAEFLVDKNEFIAKWSEYRDISDNVEYLKTYFCVSRPVILRRSFDLHFIDRQQYEEALSTPPKTNKKLKKSNGGQFYPTFYLRNSRQLINDLSIALSTGSVTYKEASHLLNVTPKTLIKSLYGSQ